MNKNLTKSSMGKFSVHSFRALRILIISSKAVEVSRSVLVKHRGMVLTNSKKKAMVKGKRKSIFLKKTNREKRMGGNDIHPELE